MNNNDDIPRLDTVERIELDIDFKNFKKGKQRKFLFFLLFLLILLAILSVFIFKKIENGKEQAANEKNEPSADISVNSRWDGAFVSEDVFNSCKEASVFIMVDGKCCSGFIYSSDGWIATVEGVVNENVKGRIEVTLFDGRSFFVESFRQSRESGLILMKIDVSGLTAVKYNSNGNIFTGQELYTFCAIHSPESDFVGGSLFSGRISHTESTVELCGVGGESRKLKLFQIGILLTEEGVGAPLFNSNGEIVGIACASETKSDRYMVDYAFAFDKINAVFERMKNGKRAEAEELFDVIVE
jgi:S1-C subfamily serine protease